MHMSTEPEDVIHISPLTAWKSHGTSQSVAGSQRDAGSPLLIRDLPIWCFVIIRRQQ